MEITKFSKEILYKYHWKYRNGRDENKAIPEEIKKDLYNKFKKNVPEYQGVIPYFTLSNVEGIYKRVLYSDEDGVVFIVAPPGAGKSTVALILSKFIDPTLLEEPERIIFNIDELKAFLKKCAIELQRAKKSNLENEKYENKLKGKVVLLDEGVFMMFSGDSTTKDGKLVQKLFSVIRALNLMFFVNVTNFKKVNKGVKEDRIIGLIKIVRRGTLTFYSKKKIRKIRILPDNIIWPRANYTELIGKIDKKSQYWKNYEMRKADFLFSSLEEPEKKTNKKK